jgi:hypothetical protein
MPRNDTGKWVARAGATGGGRTYRGQRPSKWYASLVLICIVGVALVWFSRYQRENPSSSGQPAVGTHWVAALSFDICGTTMPVLPTNPNTAAQITTQGDGLIHISPTSSQDTGANATLGRFASEYPGLTLTSTTVRYPGKTSSSTPLVGKTFVDNDKCPAHTPDAGKLAQVQTQAWSNFASNSPVPTGDPNSFKLAQGQLITVAFVPQGTSVPKPPHSTVVTLQQTINQLLTNPSGTTTTTPTATVPSTTTPTSSTAPSATTAPTTTTPSTTATPSTTTGPKPAT